MSARNVAEVSTLLWYVGGVFVKSKIERCCPLCGVRAIVALPDVLLAEQPDDTTHVCHPSLGGCNHGFALDIGITNKLTAAHWAELAASQHGCGRLGCGWEHRQTVAIECRKLGLLTADGKLTDAGRSALGVS